MTLYVCVWTCSNFSMHILCAHTYVQNVGTIICMCKTHATHTVHTKMCPHSLNARVKHGMETTVNSACANHVLKPLLMNSFGGSQLSTAHKESLSRCSPLITANEGILDDLSKLSTAHKESLPRCLPLITANEGILDDLSKLRR